MNNKVSVTFQEAHHRKLKGLMYPGDGKESVVIVLCSKVESHDRVRLLSKYIYPIADEDCTVREVDTVRWPTHLIEEALQHAEREKLSVVKVHSHPSGTKRFSSLDDKSDRELFPSIDSWVGNDLLHASLVMLPDSSMFGRTVGPQGDFRPLYLISVANDDLLFWLDEMANDNLPESARRLAQAFGEGTYNIMKKIRIGFVGCSGTGVPTITTFNLNHLGEMVLVDPDIIEEGNRNRIATATPKDIEDAISKVLNQQGAIEARGLGTKVYPYQSDISNPNVIEALGSCDILIGCVDSAKGRYFLNKISSCFLVPYFDLGVRIDTDNGTSIKGVNASMHFIKPGGSSLLSRYVYTMDQVHAEQMKATDPEEYRRQIDEGYVKGVEVERPAVASINACISSLVVEEIMARLVGYRFVDNTDFAIRRMVFCMGESLHEADEGAACTILEAIVARGDKRPLLNLPLLEVAA